MLKLLLCICLQQDVFLNSKKLRRNDVKIIGNKSWQIIAPFLATKYWKDEENLKVLTSKCCQIYSQVSSTSAFQKSYRFTVKKEEIKQRSLKKQVFKLHVFVASFWKLLHLFLLPALSLVSLQQLRRRFSFQTHFMFGACTHSFLSVAQKRVHKKEKKKTPAVIMWNLFLVFSSHRVCCLWPQR